MKSLQWRFPLPRTHTGVLLGNGTLGLMVWGDETLNLTIGRAGFWDHRGGNDFTVGVTYQEVREYLEAGDEARLRAAFAANVDRDGPERPTQLGGGRLELAFPAGVRPRVAILEPERGLLGVRLSDGGAVRIRLAVDEELAWVTLPPDLADQVQVRLVSSFDAAGPAFADRGIAAPERREGADRGSLYQPLPEDPGLGIAWRRDGGLLQIATALGSVPDPGRDHAAAAARADAWWREHTAAVPKLTVPDAVIQEVVDYGLYKLAGATSAEGVPATLQGPWLEEYQLPPWSCDYHFNINLEMIYAACLPANRCGNLAPLWRMVEDWLPRLRVQGERFFGVEGALMLPHAVDDRCRAVGQFWTGCIDHGCTAWVADLCYQHAVYAVDDDLLGGLAWELLNGAFAGYWAMLERREDGDQPSFSLPVGVSPEFRGHRMDAWGRDASFQLAACHAVVRDLRAAATRLGREVDERWIAVAEGLPPYTTDLLPHTRDNPEQRDRRIVLWQDQDLVESHRHHSHLAAIHPFQTVDPEAEAHREVVANSLWHWVRTGAGAWSGWCVPWAAQLMARCGHGDGALGWLHHWVRHFVNEGRGTLHDAAFFGASTLFGGGEPIHLQRGEVMQLDAGMGALSAVFDLCLQQRADGLHVFPARPTSWHEVSFVGIRAPGGFLVDAEVVDGRVEQVAVTATAAGELVLHHGLGDSWTCCGGSGTGPALRHTMAADERIELVRSEG